MEQPVGMKTRSGDLTESTLATIYGCCGLFDLCSDRDLMSLSFEDADPFLDWLGWLRTNVCIVKKEFISWQRPEYTGGTATGGYVADPCVDANSIEWGKCDFTLTDFGRLRRAGPVRDATMNDVRYCENQPRYRLDGTPITDDREYDARIATEVLMQDLRHLVITGAASVGGQFDGLQQLIQTGYRSSDGQICRMMDSIIVNWAGNNMNGGAGVTWNGAAVLPTFNFVDVLLDVFRHIRQRISWAPPLASQRLSVGDIVIAGPTFLLRCLLDSYTCWSVCEGTQYNEVAIQNYEARQFRNSLNGGMFGYGRIFLDGFEIPLVAYDWDTITGPNSGDLYLLTGQVGNIKTLHGEYLDMRTVPGGYPEADFFYTDGGRLLGWVKRDNTCVEQTLEFRPRILSWAPWSNARFQRVSCHTPGGPLSPDPTDTSFFPETSFSVVEC